MSKNLLILISLLSLTFTTEIYFGNVDQNSGTADILYSTTELIGGFQFEFTGGTISGASGGEASNAGFTVNTSASTILGFSFSAANLVVGNGLTLTTIEFTPDEGATQFCLNDVVLSDTGGETLTFDLGPCAEALQFDCNGDLGGTAELDECGVCQGNGIIQDCGCGAPGEFGIPEGACDCDGNIEDICGDCGGTGETLDDCVEGYSIYFENLDQVTGTVDVYYAAEDVIGGAQFSVTGITMTNASGGIAEENGWTVSTSATTWLGFSFNNVTLPSGVHLLSTIAFEAPGEGDELCFNNPILSDPNAVSLDVEVGECLPLYDYDCNGDLGGTAELDECGVCQGNGIIQDCGCGAPGEFGIPEGACDCDGNIEDICGDCGGDGSACAPGTFDVYYNIDVEFGGFQFMVNNTIITGAGGGIAEDLGFTVQAGGTGTVLGFSFQGTPIPAGTGLLTTVTTEGPNQSACLSDLIVSDMNAISLDAFISDCNTISFCEDLDQDNICDSEDDCIGVIDDCGVCNGNNASLDECGICDGDGVIQECGCGSPGEFNIPEGACDCDGNIEDICGDCGGNAVIEDDCVEGYAIYFDNLNQNAGTVDVYYASESPVGGVQFNVTGIFMTSSSGGEAENQGWTVNVTDEIWLGFSFDNIPLPQGTRLLTTLSFTAPEDSNELCFGSNVILSSTDANSFDVVIGDCLELQNYDCNGNLGGVAELDECGVCDGSGPQYECWDGSIRCDETECPTGGLLTFGEQNDNTIPVYISTNSDIAGFQFEVTGAEIVSAYGGISEELGFTLQAGNGVVLAFSFEGSSIPAGNHLLLNLELGQSAVTELCFIDGSGVISDSDANNLLVLFGDCTPIMLSSDSYISIDEFSLNEIYPNPFNARTTINYSVPNTDYMELSIYDINGQIVKTLINSPQNIGHYNITWDADDIPSGIYFIKLTVNNIVKSQRITLMK